MMRIYPCLKIETWNAFLSSPECLRHRPLCGLFFLTLRVKLFLIRHTVSFLQKCPKIRFTAFYALKASRGAARPVQTLSESYRAILRPPKWQTTPVLRTAPLRGRNHRGTGIPLYPLRAGRLMRSILEEALSVLRKAHCTSRKRHA